MQDYEIIILVLSLLQLLNVSLSKFKTAISNPRNPLDSDLKDGQWLLFESFQPTLNFLF